MKPKLYVALAGIAVLGAAMLWFAYSRGPLAPAR